MTSGDRVVAGAVLAAGAGTRMGAPKADLLVDGVRLVDRAVAVLHAAQCDDVIAVLRSGTRVTGAREVINAHPEDGLRSSLALAVHAAADAHVLVVILADMPGIDADAVIAVLGAWRPGRIAIARYPSRQGHPIAMAPGLWRQSLDLAPPDEGARALLTARPELIDEVVVTGDLADLDSPDDLAQWQRRT
jgi:molybdenum cofactor cytidylyltransferase/nicotine blue oxidoreductase